MLHTTLNDWTVRCYASGTVVVCRSYEEPHLYIYYASDIRDRGISESECDSKRYEYAKDLADYLNGGERPTWLDTYKRVSPRQVENDLGGTITATGPMVLPPDDNGRLAWQTCEKSEPVRVALIDSLRCNSAV